MQWITAMSKIDACFVLAISSGFFTELNYGSTSHHFQFRLFIFQISNIVHISSMVDEYMSCDRLFGGGSTEGANARSARQLLETIPCDMKKQSFCANKGTAYPE